MMSSISPAIVLASGSSGQTSVVPAGANVLPEASMIGAKLSPDMGLINDIARVANDRDRQAFARLYSYYAPRIAAYLRRVGARGENVEDLAQESMLSVWRRAHQFDPTKAALSTWIYTIARNKRIDALRRERHPDIDIDDPTLISGEAVRGDVHVEAEVVKEGIKKAISSLPVEQAELLRIFYFEDKTHSVIADELGLPLGTVKSRLRLAVAKLRSLLEGVQ